MAWSVQAAMASLKERKKKIEIKAKSRRNARGDCIKERTVRRAPHMIENPAFRHAARVLAFPTRSKGGKSNQRKTCKAKKAKTRR